MRCQWPHGVCVEEAMPGRVHCAGHIVMSYVFNDPVSFLQRKIAAVKSFEIKVSDENGPLRKINDTEYERNSKEVIDCRSRG